jgi:hypothetical protein
MITNINFKDESGDLFTQKLKWIQVMPSSRKNNIYKIDIHNPDEESKSNKIIELFPNIKFVKTNLHANRLITNYITNYDLIIINDFTKEFNKDFFIKKVKSLSENGKMWIFCDGLEIFNKLLKELEDEFEVPLKKFVDKNLIVDNEFDNLFVKYFKTNIDYLYSIHTELLNFIFTKNYIPLEKKTLIKSYLLKNFTDYTKISFSVYIVG